MVDLKFIKMSPAFRLVKSLSCLGQLRYFRRFMKPSFREIEWRLKETDISSIIWEPTLKTSSPETPRSIFQNDDLVTFQFGNNYKSRVKYAC